MSPEFTTQQAARFWDAAAAQFDAIYSGKKAFAGRLLDHWLRRDVYQRFDWVMSKCGDISGKTVGDIGCGSGRYMVEFARRRAARVTGLDVSPEMLRLARQLTDAANVGDRCEFVQADIRDSREDRQFDITVAMGFWDYVAEPRHPLEVVRAITKETFLSAWPRFWTWRMPIRKARLSLSGCQVFFYREGQVVRLMQEVGFEIVSCDTIGKLFCVEARPSPGTRA